MEERLCEVRCYRGPCVEAPPAGSGRLHGGCDKCRVGCFEPGRFKNPLFSPLGGPYNYAEWLCAPHYDKVVDYIERKNNSALEPWELDDDEMDSIG